MQRTSSIPRRMVSNQATATATSARAMHPTRTPAFYPTLPLSPVLIYPCTCELYDPRLYVVRIPGHTVASGSPTTHGCLQERRTDEAVELSPLVGPPPVSRRRRHLARVPLSPIRSRGQVTWTGHVECEELPLDPQPPAACSCGGRLGQVALPELPELPGGRAAGEEAPSVPGVPSVPGACSYAMPYSLARVLSTG